MVVRTWGAATGRKYILLRMSLASPAITMVLRIPIGPDVASRRPG
jgi:hypothetical protein